ncbi:glycoside hydrolase domain-containing protein [Labedaea rhizosphaerae]|uniref:VCBS repeat protein n=1 Tax=Labedaea rhizosphaerae TaxID=598644 RepID=A0A4R6SGM4_LABRH|nr:glycoside hydrolase domain-containing protein [Labedaea rhizosphaerae]TDQ00707.1 VCBS repeat protein [Labedaea rhizosphaerae]
MRAVALLVIASLALLAPVASVPAAAAPAPVAFTGRGFDACSAPSSAAMDAWLASPYRAVGIYFGGSNRGCTQPNLTAAWVTHQQAGGWHLLPIYFGLQAPCTTSTKPNRIDPAQAAAQGRAEADSAVTAASALGLGRGSALIFDMEAYQTGNAACTTAVLDFLGAWTSRLHDRGYFSVVYSSLASGVADLVADYNSTSRPRPDYLYFARYDGLATTDNSAIPAGYWTPNRRMHQYAGGHDETYGGVTINIDNDYVDVKPLPAPTFGDFNENGWTDLIARDKTSGQLYLYAGNGTNVGNRVGIGSGWGNYPTIIRFGDFTRDGHEDVIARESTTGYLWLYPGTGTGLTTRIRIGTGWNGMREITAIGDLSGDGYPDVLAVESATGYLFLYPGHGTSLGTKVKIGSGWNAMGELTGIGDLDADGKPDLLARNNSTGALYRYSGRGPGVASGVVIGSSWTSMRDLTGVGDFNRDGHPDLIAVRAATGTLYLYPGTTGRLASGIALSTGWTNFSPLF